MLRLTNQVKKQSRFLTRFFLLVGFKQSYFFAKNAWGMIVHPQLTTAKIISQKDFPQAFLVFGLPFNLWLVLSALAFSVWFFLRPSGFFLKLGLVGFLLGGSPLFLLAIYYLYWVIRYFRKKTGFK